MSISQTLSVVLAAADEVVRDGDAGELAAGEPGCNQRALAHAGPAADQDPAVAAVGHQQFVELGEQRGAADETFVALPLDRVIDTLP